MWLPTPCNGQFSLSIMLEGPHRTLEPTTHHCVALPMDTKIDLFLRDFSKNRTNLDGTSSALTKLVHRYMFLDDSPLKAHSIYSRAVERGEDCALKSEMAEKDVWSPKTRRVAYSVNAGFVAVARAGESPVGGENVFPVLNMPRSAPAARHGLLSCKWVAAGSEARRCRGDCFGGLNKWVRSVRARGAWVQERGGRPWHDRSLSHPNRPPPPPPLPNMPQTSGKQYRRNTPSSHFTQSSPSRRPKA
ncbi:hypothetical protein DFH08DRAFT_943577 [Mycena albidolilacea]|uniref:Uncharacterized protein n=1 Tax=Mycena albidolilacea TaxID=1033008 RepID=A0AAD7ECI4_9AGAR|nr:hypothetical protein DFH08DRAFT_943577 [Mycena albidolilacea]